jgi:hypothetical protein
MTINVPRTFLKKEINWMIKNEIEKKPIFYQCHQHTS